MADLARTPAQRRADALVEMARRAGTAPVDGRRPEPLFSVVVGYETLHGRICELEWHRNKPRLTGSVAGACLGRAGWSSTRRPGSSMSA